MGLLIKWEDMSDNEKGFGVFRKVNSGSYDQISDIQSSDPFLSGWMSLKDTDIQSNTTYQYKICSYNDFGEIFSDEASTTTAQIPPNQPPETYLTGPNGATIESDKVTFYPSAIDDITPSEKIQYSWQLDNGLWTDFDYLSKIELHGIGKGPHRLKVEAKDDDGLIDETPATASFSGTINHHPSTPINIYPFDGETTLPLQILLIASYYSDIDTSSTFTCSQFQIRLDEGNYDSPVWDCSDLIPPETSIQIPIGILNYKIKYFWRVRYQDETGLWSAWSSETSFSTKPPMTFEELKDYILGRMGISPQIKIDADKNNDGIIDVADLVTLIIRQP